MMVFTVFCGMGIGGEITVAGTIMNEYLPPSKAWVFTLLCSSWAIGGILSAGMATGVVAADYGGIEVWRQCCIISLLMEIAFFVIRLWIRETPRFLYDRGMI